jgi:pyrroloquinoline quinone (PQQ) biosynthesis protein C
MLSVDWMRALAEALSVHFPHFKHEPYFADCFSQQVEERHATEALEVTQMVLRARPELLHETLRDAKMMAEALDGVWTHLDRICRNARAQGASRSAFAVERNWARIAVRRARARTSPPSPVTAELTRAG